MNFNSNKFYKSLTRWLMIALGVFLFSQAFPIASRSLAGELSFVSDSISTSAPNQQANHTISFTTASNIPASGYIVVDFPVGITIPSAFNLDDIDLLVNGVQRTLAAAPSGGTIGVTVGTGNGGQVTFRLGTGSIASGSEIVVRLGTHAEFDVTPGINSLINGNAPGSYLINISTKNSSNVQLDSANAIAVIIAQVSAGARFGVEEPEPEEEDAPSAAMPVHTTQLTVSGWAYPSSKVYILQDGRIIAVTQASRQADFSAKVGSLSIGSHIIGVYAEDNRGNRSLTKTFQVFITPGSGINISNVFIAPTVELDNSSIHSGNPVAVFGQTAPSAKVVISMEPGKREFTADADINGVYLYYLDTVALSPNIYTLKSSSEVGANKSSFGKIVTLDVVDPKQEPVPACKKADLNSDGRVNNIDFTIARAWYRRDLSPSMSTREACSLNNDQQIDLVDFSIIAYFWTG